MDRIEVHGGPFALVLEVNGEVVADLTPEQARTLAEELLAAAGQAAGRGQ